MASFQILDCSSATLLLFLDKWAADIQNLFLIAHSQILMPILLEVIGFYSRGWNVFFLFDWSFLVLTKITLLFTYCNKGFGGAVSHLFDPAFAGSFPHFSYKEVPDLQKINLFTLILFNIFFSENTAIHGHLVPNTLEIQSRTRLTVLQRQHILHKYSVKHNSFDLSGFDIKSKYSTFSQHQLWFVEPYWLSGSYTSKIALVIKDCKTFLLVTMKTRSFNQLTCYVFRDSFIFSC